MAVPESGKSRRNERSRRVEGQFQQPYATQGRKVAENSHGEECLK